ncbi:MAG: tyrosine-type recombinase/integrase, partial [Planctomycetota bacterium]
MMEICRAFIDHCAKTKSEATHKLRRRFLFDFATGLPGRFCTRKANATSADKIHKGYGATAVGDLTPQDIQDWLDAHPQWKNSATKTAVTSLHAAINHALRMGRIDRNPIKGFHPGKWETHITCFDETVEAALYKHANAPLALAVRVMVGTGARPGEFAKVTPRHVKQNDRGMVWVFSPGEHKTGSKTGRPRTVLVPDSVAELVRGAMTDMPDMPDNKPIFRNNRGTPWTSDTLSQAFRLLRGRLVALGFDLTNDDTIYSCRHTYARRMLCGTPDRPPVTLEVLSGLMGNTPKVCYAHYAQWDPRHEDAL